RISRSMFASTSTNRVTTPPMAANTHRHHIPIAKNRRMILPVPLCTPSPAPHLRIPETVGRVVVHHANRLHEGIADCGADEVETALLEILAHGIRKVRLRWDLPHRFPCVLYGHSIHIPPEKSVQ